MSAMPDLGRPPDIPPEAITLATALMETWRLHRYSEAGGDGGTVAALERAFARLIGRRYAVALNSCGSALFIALRTAGVQPGTPVLLNAFTLGPVPGALQHVGARPVLVEITEDLVIDMDDLLSKARASGARHLMLSHMRGHICDLAALAALCAEEGITLIEDCAHTLGAHWAGRPTGSFGQIGCFSFQSSKHVNAGEGGVLVTDDDAIAAQAILHSGSYRLYAQNGTCPPEEVMVEWAERCGNFSLRMSALTAALALPQLPLLPARVADWNASHDRIAAALTASAGFVLPHRPQPEAYAQSSLQFRLPSRDASGMSAFVDAARKSGVWVKWFGRPTPEGYSSNPAQWPETEAAEVPRACTIQSTLCDIRLPLGLGPADCDRIADALIRAAQMTDECAPHNARA